MKKILMLGICTILVQTSILFSRDLPPVGKMTVYTCSMWGSKTFQLIEEAQGARRKSPNSVLVIKPVRDNRKLGLSEHQDPTKVLASRINSSIPCECTPVTDVADLREKIEKFKPQTLVIDEVHFFTGEKEEFIKLIQTCMQNGMEIHAAGLDLNFRNEPFEITGALCCYATKVKKYPANCAVCGRRVRCITQRLINGKPAPYDSPLILVGAEELYEPRCEACHQCEKPQ